MKEERESKILDLTYKYEDYDLSLHTKKVQNENLELTNLILKKSNLLGTTESMKTKYKLTSLEYLSRIKSKEKEIKDEERSLKEINE